MTDPGATRWSLIEQASSGDRRAQETFARTYEPAVRAYLGARWRTAGLRDEVADATQEVFLACLRTPGPLTRADPDRGGGFRAYLYGIVRNIARRVERRRLRRPRQPDSWLQLDRMETDEPSLSRIFDRAWAQGILREAVRVHRERATEADEAALRRVEVLRLRFREGLPIRDIARRWEEDPARVHKAYARARKEFADALRSVVRRHCVPGGAGVDAECARLVQYLRPS